MQIDISTHSNPGSMFRVLAMLEETTPPVERISSCGFCM